MHYQINDVLIKSELAAKSNLQPNQNVIQYINTIPLHYKVLDYGCGKLRYTIPLAKRVKSVVAIDSKEQLSKLQIIDGKRTTLLDVDICNVSICSIEDERWKKDIYDLVFCTNVLSAIPFENIRLALLQQAFSVLKKGGKMFIVVQYRNSYFSSYDERESTQRYNDGWLLCKNKSQYFFYAPLSSEYIVSLCEKAGFNKFSVKKQDGSCYIIAEKQGVSID